VAGNQERVVTSLRFNGDLTIEDYYRKLGNITQEKLYE
jgi:hypothetical protein